MNFKNIVALRYLIERNKSLELVFYFLMDQLNNYVQKIPVVQKCLRINCIKINYQ